MTFDNDHCNHCDQLIVWWNPKTGNPEYHPKTHKKRPFNPLDLMSIPPERRGELHLCMYKGQPDYFTDGKKVDRPPGPPGYYYTMDDY